MTDLQRDKELLLRMARVSATATVAMLHPSFDELSKREAEALHGRKWLDYHIEKGNIAPRQKGRSKNSKHIYSRTEIAALWEAEAAMKVKV